MLLITNNPKVNEEISGVKISYHLVDYGEILAMTKKLIVKQKMVLLTHPLSGSIKPNETYYKSIILDDRVYQEIDIESLDYIDSAIRVYQKFMKNKMRPNWTEKVLRDFAFVDFYIIKSTLENIHVY